MSCLTSGGVFEDTASLSVLLRLMSSKERNGNHLNQIKMDTQERMEYVQDVIDRLLYLKGEKLTEYQHYLDVLKDIYPIDVTMVNGIRVYHAKVDTK